MMFELKVKISCSLFKIYFSYLLWISEIVPRKMETEDQFWNIKEKFDSSN